MILKIIIFILVTSLAVAGIHARKFPDGANDESGAVAAVMIGGKASMLSPCTPSAGSASSSTGADREELAAGSVKLSQIITRFFSRAGEYCLSKWRVANRTDHIGRRPAKPPPFPKLPPGTRPVAACIQLPYSSPPADYY